MHSTGPGAAKICARYGGAESWWAGVRTCCRLFSSTSTSSTGRRNNTVNGDTFRTPGNSERRERRVRGAVNGAERPFRKFWAFCFVHWQVVWCGSPALRLFSNYVVLHTKLPARRCCEPAAATSGAQAAGERVRLAALFRNHLRTTQYASTTWALGHSQQHPP